MSWESLKKVQRIFLSVIIWLILVTNREEKSLRHVVMVATFLDDNKPKILFKSKFALFQSSSNLFNFIWFVKCWWNFLDLIWKDRILV